MVRPLPQAKTQMQKRRRARGYVAPEDLSIFGGTRIETGGLALTVPFPPSLNDLYTPLGRGRSVKSKIGREYEELVLRVMARSPKPPAGSLTLMGTFWVPDRIKRDLDNMLKATLDSLKAALGFKDEDVTAICVNKSLHRGSVPRAVLYLDAGEDV